MTFLATFLKTETLVMENYCPHVLGASGLGNLTTGQKHISIISQVAKRVISKYLRIYINILQQSLINVMRRNEYMKVNYFPFLCRLSLPLSFWLSDFSILRDGLSGTYNRLARETWLWPQQTCHNDSQCLKMSHNVSKCLKHNKHNALPCLITQQTQQKHKMTS